MEKKRTFTVKKLLGIIIPIFLVVIGLLFYQRNQYTHLDVMEFRLRDVRLELPCTADDIRACGYHVGNYSGECDYNEYGLGTIYISQDENGMVYEIYAADAMCDLEIYGNIHMFYPLEKYKKDITKAYGKPVEEDGNSKTYIKYKTETEYAYVTINGDIAGVSRVGIVANKPLPSSNNEKTEAESQQNDVLFIETDSGDKIETEYITIDDKFKIKVPKNFKRLDDEIISEKYNGDVPDMVFSNDEIDINIAVSLTDNQITDNKIKEYKELMENLLKNQGEIVFTDYHNVDNHNVGQIKLITDAIDTQIYNNMIFFSYDGKLVLISFNCTENLKDEWDDVGDFIINSLSFNE